MISEIEIAKSGNAKCKSCGKLIGKGTPRGVQSTKQSYGISYNYFDYKCTREMLKEQIKQTKELQKELNKLIKEKTKEIIVGEL